MNRKQVSAHAAAGAAVAPPTLKSKNKLLWLHIFNASVLLILLIVLSVLHLAQTAVQVDISAIYSAQMLAGELQAQPPMSLTENQTDSQEDDFETDNPLQPSSQIPTVERQYKIAVEPIKQNPELPNGCEITSLSMALQYWGYTEADKIYLAKYYLPVAPYYGSDPEEVYCGDPFSESIGFYCFTQPIVTAAENFIRDMGGSQTATDISGASMAALKAYLRQGYPVIAWVTLEYNQPVKTAFCWYIDDTPYYPYANLHCVVLTGYDEDNVYICDPLKGEIAIPAEQFETVYTQMGSRAVVITP